MIVFALWRIAIQKRKEIIIFSIEKCSTQSSYKHDKNKAEVSIGNHMILIPFWNK